MRVTRQYISHHQRRLSSSVVSEEMYGSSVLSSSEDAADAYSYALDQYVSGRRVSLSLLRTAAEKDKHFVTARYLHDLIVWMRRRNGEETDDPIDDGEKEIASGDTEAGRRDRTYAFVLSALSQNRVHDAANVLDELVLANPTDLLTIKLAHETHAAAGDVRSKRNLIPRVMEHWNDGFPGYSHLLAMHAAALNDDVDYANAEDLSMRVLSMNSDEINAVAVASSAMISQSRPREAVRMIREFRDAWYDEATSMAFRDEQHAQQQHLGWLWAIADVDQGQYEKAMRRLDMFGIVGVAEGHDGRKPTWSLVDAVSLLHRLRLCDVDVDKPWAALYDAYGVDGIFEDDALRSPMYNIHRALLFSYSDRHDLVDDMINVIEARSESTPATSHDELRTKMTLATTGTICRAVNSLRSDPSHAMSTLLSSRYELDHLGGHTLHRDLLCWILLDCCIRGEEYVWGRAIASERLAQLPGNAQTWRMHAEILHALGEESEADRSYMRALDLGLGQGGKDTH